MRARRVKDSPSGLPSQGEATPRRETTRGRTRCTVAAATVGVSGPPDGSHTRACQLYPGERYDGMTVSRQWRRRRRPPRPVSSPHPPRSVASVRWRRGAAAVRWICWWAGANGRAVSRLAARPTPGAIICPLSALPLTGGPRASGVGAAPLSVPGGGPIDSGSRFACAVRRENLPSSPVRRTAGAKGSARGGRFRVAPTVPMFCRGQS